MSDINEQMLADLNKDVTVEDLREYEQIANFLSFNKSSRKLYSPEYKRTKCRICTVDLLKSFINDVIHFSKYHPDELMMAMIAGLGEDK